MIIKGLAANQNIGRGLWLQFRAKASEGEPVQPQVRVLADSGCTSRLFWRGAKKFKANLTDYGPVVSHGVARNGTWV